MDSSCHLDGIVSPLMTGAVVALLVNVNDHLILDLINLRL